jgi:hypothetical protein
MDVVNRNGPMRGEESEADPSIKGGFWCEKAMPIEWWCSDEVEYELWNVRHSVSKCV